MNPSQIGVVTTAPFPTGTILTRMIVSLPKGGTVTVNKTTHVVSRIFSENGVLIDQTYFKVYMNTLGKVKNHYEDKGYAAEVIYMGGDSDDERFEKELLEHVQAQVEADYQMMMHFRHKANSGEKSYISEVDRKPWGVDKTREYD